MLDGHKRVIDYLRISVTDRCNLRCLYCMPPEGVPWTPHQDILTYEELLRLAEIFAGLGIKKIRITGGEPLVRRGLTEFLKRLKEVPGIEALSLTTNGLLLAEQLPGLAEAGVGGINISIDALEEERYRQITGGYGASKALAALDQALSCPGMNVKLNCVPVGLNDDQLPLLAALAKDRPLAVRFIELMPIGLGKGLECRTEEQVRRMLEESFGALKPVQGPPGSGPGRYFSLPGFQGRIGFISALSHQFCEHCNRVRLTSGGFLKTCLQYERGADLKSLLRSGAPDREIRDAISGAVRDKPASHHFRDGAGGQDLERHIMSQIGG